ncbi:MAG: hypothetical protein WAV20_03400 [Blastocatellia bacterium]
MILAQATASFLEFSTQNESGSQPQLQSLIHEASLRLVTEYFPRDADLSDITPSSLRDFLTRCYLEKACSASLSDCDSVEHDAVLKRTPSMDGSRATNDQARLVSPSELMSTLSDFFVWADDKAGVALSAECATILRELQKTLPRALEISDALARSLRRRGGGFTFPEFLTSFEEGGHSEYDIGPSGSVGALEGYFRVIRVEGSSVEAEELVSERRVWPIIFPIDAAGVDEEYILNLEIVRTSEGWKIAGCGFAYPPGTEV